MLDPTLDGQSVADGEYYVIAIAFAGDLSSSMAVTAEPTNDVAGEEKSREASPIMIEEMTWNGNGSLISLASGERTGYGLTLDETMIHPSSPSLPAVFFQWEIDGRDGRRVKLEAEGMSQATIRYGAWNDRSADVTHTVTLPYTLDPAADGLVADDGQYYVIMVGFDRRPTQSTSVIATIVE